MAEGQNRLGDCRRPGRLFLAPDRPVIIKTGSRQLVAAAATCRDISDSLARWAYRQNDPALKATLSQRAKELDRVAAKVRKLAK
jgi:hypothetical protein